MLLFGEKLRHCNGMQTPGYFERFFRGIPTMMFLREDLGSLLCNVPWHVIKKLSDETPLMSEDLLGAVVFLFPTSPTFSVLFN